MKYSDRGTFEAPELTCTAEHRDHYDGTTWHCTKDPLHLGEHQQVVYNDQGEMVKTRGWSKGGTVSTPIRETDQVMVCPRCGSVDRPDGWMSDLRDKMMRLNRCHRCVFYLDRKKMYDEGRSFVSGGRWITPAEISGAFAGKLTLIVTDEGKVFGPWTQNWDGGELLPEELEECPNNSTVFWGREATLKAEELNLKAEELNL